MTGNGSDPSVERAWARQSVWSQVAGRLKKTVRRARVALLALTIGGAVLATTGAILGVDTTQGKVLVFAAALAGSIAGIARAAAGSHAIRDWTRARSAAEAIKSEVYSHLAGVGGDLAGRVDSVEHEVDDLLVHTLGVEPGEREPPDVHDIESYSEQRVRQQIIEYYRPQAVTQQRLLSRARFAEITLALLSAALAAAAAAWAVDAVAVWVPVVTTVSAAVIAHATAERYEYLLVEYLRTAAELERLLERHASGELGDAEFVRACEHVISVQNEGWMAKLTSEPKAAES